MYRIFFLIITAFLNPFIQAQELNCIVTINHDKVRSSNNQIYKTLEKAVKDYINNTTFTKKEYKKQEKIKCAITFNITEQPSNDKFKGTLQVQSLRPIYNSTYESPVLNISDENLSFQYEEFQPLIFNESNFESNLISILTFYAYIILGLDDDTFALNGGDENLKKAEQVMLVAQQGGYKGWKQLDGNKTRYQLIDNLLNPMYKNYRSTMYKYHRFGLDTMYEDKEQAKINISNSIIQLKSIYSRRPTAYLLRIFLDTKQNEIISIFKDGPKVNTLNLQEMLMRVYPTRATDWAELK